MITFPETLDSLERLSENLHAIDNLDTCVLSTLKELDGFLATLQYSHEKNFQSPDEALAYIDQVLIPQLRGIRDSLVASAEPPIRNLKVASEQTDRLVLRLRMVVDGDVGEFLP